MKEYKLHPVEGVRDFLPKEQKQKNEIERRINKVFYQYGYNPIQTPTFEYVEVFAEEDGSFSRKEMYKFLDRKGNVLALRPDLTPPIARVVATSFQEDIFPLRLSYVGSAYRYIQGYQGKLHEFTQAGVELLGNNSTLSDAEIISIAVNSLQSVGVKEFIIHLGQVEFFKVIMEAANLDKDVIKEIGNLIENKNIVALEGFVSKYVQNEELSKLLLELPKLCGGIEVLGRVRELTSNTKLLYVLDKLEQTFEILCEYNVEKYIAFDLGMVSRLEYYTGVILRGYTHESGASILDGGRYDKLIEKFGKCVPAIGFGINIHELLNALTKQKSEIDTWSIDTLIMFTPKGRKMAIQTGEELRRTGLYIENSLYGEDLEKNINYAKQKNIPGILFFKDEEYVELINMQSNERFTTTISELLQG